MPPDEHINEQAALGRTLRFFPDGLTWGGVTWPAENAMQIRPVYDHEQALEDKQLAGDTTWPCKDGPFGANTVLEVKPAQTILVLLEADVPNGGRLLAMIDSAAGHYQQGQRWELLISEEWAGSHRRKKGPKVTLGGVGSGVWATSDVYVTITFACHYSGARTEEEESMGLPAEVHTTGGQATCLVIDNARWSLGGFPAIGNLRTGVVLSPAALHNKHPSRAWIHNLWVTTHTAQTGKAPARTHAAVMGAGQLPSLGNRLFYTQAAPVHVPGDAAVEGGDPLGIFNDANHVGEDAPGGTHTPFKDRSGIPKPDELRGLLAWNHLEPGYREQLERVGVLDEFMSLLDNYLPLFGDPRPGGAPLVISVTPGTKPNRSGLHQRIQPGLVTALYEYTQALVNKGMVVKITDDVTAPGAIKPGQHYNSLVVATRADGRIRMCVNPKDVNANLPKEDAFKASIPHIEDLVAGVRGGGLFTTLDLRDAYHQRRLHPSSWDLFCFPIKNPGTGRVEGYQYTCLLFGIAPAPGLFQEQMEVVMEGPRTVAEHNNAFVQVYLDDVTLGTRESEGFGGVQTQVVPHSVTDIGTRPLSDPALRDLWDRHKPVLDATFRAMMNAELSLNAEKCAFLGRKAAMLGVVVDGQYYAVDPSRTQGFGALATVPQSPSLAWLRRLMGVLVAYKVPIGKEWLRHSQPLADLLKKATNAARLATDSGDPQERRAAATMVGNEWSDLTHGTALRKLVAALCLNAVRALPDHSLPFYVEGDASDAGYGNTLSQYHGGQKFVVDAMSVVFNGSQRKWGVGVRELYTQLQAARRWWRLTAGCKVIWRNDHHNLLEVTQLKSMFVQRWVMELSLLEAWSGGTRVFVDGNLMSLADKLSRDRAGKVQEGDEDYLLIPESAALALDTVREKADELQKLRILTTQVALAADTQYHAMEVLAVAEMEPQARVELVRALMQLRMLQPLSDTALADVAQGKAHVSHISALLDQALEAQKAMTVEERQGLCERWAVPALGSPPSRLVEIGDRGATVLLYKGRVVIPASAVELRNKLYALFHGGLHDHMQACLDRMRAAALHVVDAETTAAAYYSSCAVCSLARAPKGPRQVNPMLLTQRPQKPAEAVFMDYATVHKCSVVPGSTKPGQQGELGLLLIVCACTGWMMAIPVSQYTGAQSLQGLKTWAGNFGFPSTVHVDGGTHFQGVFAEFLLKHGISLDVGTPHHHEGRGLVEARVKRLVNALKKFVPAGRMDDWPAMFPALTFAANNVPSGSHGGFSPNQLMWVGTPSGAQSLFGCAPGQSAESLMNLVQALRSMASVAADMHAVRYKGVHDRALVPFNPQTGASGPQLGDWVLAVNTIKEDKMSPPFDGPYVVVDVETGPNGVPTGWCHIAEVLGGLSPGQKGYPARGKPKWVVVDRLWPFDHSRSTANEMMQWKLPDGWAVVTDVLAGPRDADGQFQVKWAHREEPSWVHASEIASTVAFKAYCEERKLNMKTLTEHLRQLAVAGKGAPLPRGPRRSPRTG